MANASDADGAAVANPAAVSDKLAAGTRAYNFASATRTTFGAASVAVALGGLNAAREVMLTATADCHIAFGTSSAVAVASTNAAALSLFAGDRFHLRLAADVTHLAVIQESAAGVLRVIPVA